MNLVAMGSKRTPGPNSAQKGEASGETGEAKIDTTRGGNFGAIWQDSTPWRGSQWVSRNANRSVGLQLRRVFDQSAGRVPNQAFSLYIIVSRRAVVADSHTLRTRSWAVWRAFC